MANETYSADDIVKLEYPTSIKKRPSMYLGSRGQQMTVGSREIIDNSTHESLRGFATRMRVTFNEPRSITIEDNGRGLPTDINAKTGQNGIILTMATLHSGGNFTNTAAAGKSGAGLNGVGASATNALSKRFDVNVYKKGKKYSLSFQNGYAGHFDGEGPDAKFTPSTDVVESKDERSPDEKKLFKTGTSIRLWFNEEYFPSDEIIDIPDLIDRLKYTAYIVPKFHIDVIDKTNQNEDGTDVTYEFYSEHGMQEMVEVMAPDAELPGTESKGDIFKEKGIYYLNTEAFYNEITSDENGKVVDLKRTVTAELAFRYGVGYEKTIASFVNTIHTHNGGVHEQAFEKALVDTFGARMKSMRGIMNAKDEDPIIDDFFEGMTIGLSVNVPEPQFVGQQKDKLSGPEVKKALTKAFTELLSNFVSSSENQAIVRPMLEKVAQASRNRHAAAEAKLAKRKSNQVSSSAMPAKLADCDLTGTEESELLICLKGDTKIMLSNGETPTIESLVGQENVSVASFNGSERIDTVATEIFKTRETKEMLEIEFEDGSVVECTPEHRFLVDGKWVQAKDLIEGADVQDVN